jgi:hypothetical protein
VVRMHSHTHTHTHTHLKDNLVDVEDEHDGNGRADDEIDGLSRKSKEHTRKQYGSPRKNLTH